MKNTGLIILFSMLMPILTCCIHTYPNGEGIDPTLVQVGVEMTVEVNWETTEAPFSKAENHTNDCAYRLIIEFNRNDRLTGRCQHLLTQEEFETGHIKLIMPFDFHAVTYNVIAWLDCVDPVTHKDSPYDTEDFEKVVRNDHHIVWGNNMLCAYAKDNIDLHAYKDQWGTKVKVPLTLTLPIGRIRIIASDIEEFRDYIKSLPNQEETYSVCIAVDNYVPQGFNAIENKVIFRQESEEFYFPMPESGNEIASGTFFVDEPGTQLSAKVLIYNSARLIVSKSPEIQIPLERGKVTVVTGSLLTDFYTNSINVNTAWDGEIIIEL